MKQFNAQQPVRDWKKKITNYLQEAVGTRAWGKQTHKQHVSHDKECKFEQMSLPEQQQAD